MGVSGGGGGGGMIRRQADVAVKDREDGHAGDDDADELLAELQHRDGGDGDGLVAAFAGDDRVAEAYDAGHDRDAADEEDGADFPLLVRGHGQAPDGGDGDDQDHDVAGDVDGAGADQQRVFVNALGGDAFGIFSGAFGCFGDDQGDGVEDVVPEAEPDRPPDGRPFGAFWNEKTEIEKQDGDFGAAHPYSRNDHSGMEILRLRLSTGVHILSPTGGGITSLNSANLALETFHRSLPPPHCKSRMANAPRVTMKIQPRRHVA